MKDEDLADTLLDFQARIIAHEDILRHLVLKIAHEQTVGNEARLQWIKDLQESLTTVRLGVISKAGYKPDYMEVDREVTKHVDRFFKPFR